MEVVQRYSKQAISFDYEINGINIDILGFTVNYSILKNEDEYMFKIDNVSILKDIVKSFDKDFDVNKSVSAIEQFLYEKLCAFYNGKKAWFYECGAHADIDIEKPFDSFSVDQFDSVAIK